MEKWKGKYPYILLVLANIIWGGNFVIGRVGAGYFPPITFSLLRWLLAFLFLSPFMIKKLRRDFAIFWQYKWMVLTLSITGIAGYNTLLYYSLHFTTSINASVVNSTTPLVMVVLSIFILKERLSLKQTAGIAFSIIGIVFILSKGSLQALAAFSFNSGDLIVLVAVVSWSIYSIVIKKYAAVLPVYTTFYVTSILGILLLTPLSLLELKQGKILLTPASVVILLYVGLFASIVAFLSWNIGVAKAGAAKSGIFINLLPVFATIFATLFNGESLMWYQLAGGAIVLLGVLLSSWAPVKERALSASKAEM
ncbi:DMT family transporter [Bacillota bacterium Lsc_1132]